MEPTDSVRPWLVLAALCIGVFLVAVDNTNVNVALPTLARELHASNSSLQWIVDAYSLPFASLLLAGGAASDRFGRRRVMQGALVAFAFFSFLAARCHGVPELLAARALMGAAAAFIFPATLSILTTTFADLGQRARAFGVWSATAGAAIAIGPIVGGALLIHFWYGSIFLINVPIVVVALAASAAVVPESRIPVASRFDLAGLLIGTVGVGGLVLAIIEGPSWGWRAPLTLVLFGSTAVIFTAFVRLEVRREHAMLDVRVFAQRAFSAGAGSIATAFFCLFGFIFMVTQYFQLVRGYSALSAGVHTVPFAVVTMLVAPLGAVLALRLGARLVVSTGLLVMAAALLWAATLGPSRRSTRRRVSSTARSAWPLSARSSRRSSVRGFGSTWLDSDCRRG